MTSTGIKVPIRRGTAKRLGLRPPQPLAAYRRRWVMGLSGEQAAKLGAFRRWVETEWPEFGPGSAPMQIAPYVGKRDV